MALQAGLNGTRVSAIDLCADVAGHPGTNPLRPPDAPVLEQVGLDRGPGDGLVQLDRPGEMAQLRQGLRDLGCDGEKRERRCEEEISI